MSGLAWYVVQSRPRKEKFVRAQIEEMGREVFLPLISERRSRTRSYSVGPLFPSYLFTRLSEEHGDIPRVRWTPGVCRVLGDREGARPVDASVVELLKTRTDEKGKVRLGLGLRKGQRIQVVAGPLAGLLGVLERVTSGPGERVRVLLEIFQRAIPVEIEAEAVRGISRS